MAAKTAPSSTAPSTSSARAMSSWSGSSIGSLASRSCIHILKRMFRAEAGFRSLTEAVDTTTAAGRMLTQMLGSFAAFERAMTRERTRTGLEAARAEGRAGGRRPKLKPQQRARSRSGASDAAPRGALRLGLQLGIVLLDEGSDLVGHLEKPRPLLLKRSFSSLSRASSAWSSSSLIVSRLSTPSRPSGGRRGHGGSGARSTPTRPSCRSVQSRPRISGLGPVGSRTLPGSRHRVPERP